MSFDPVHFIRSHSKNNDPADIQTQVRNIFTIDYCFFVPLKVGWFRNVFLLTLISSKKQTKKCHIVAKMNSIVRFLEEFSTCQFAFEINWPLRTYKVHTRSNALHYKTNLLRSICFLTVSGGYALDLINEMSCTIRSPKYNF